MKPIVDIHMHIVPGVDDGSRSIRESLLMLEFAENQGITDVFCTSHNGYSEEDGEKYNTSFKALKQKVEQSKLAIHIHKGCEVLCAGEYIDDILYGLEIGVFNTLGESKCVLTELYSDTKPSEALHIINALKKNGYSPIIAHMERNYNITGRMVGLLIAAGAMIQVNAISYAEETDTEIKERAKELLRNRYVHFVGSDSHRIDHRPPIVAQGVQYILENTDEEYSNAILFENARELLLK